MFKSLKEKLSKWIKKNEEIETDIEIEEAENPTPKESKRKKTIEEKKQEKEEKKQKLTEIKEKRQLEKEARREEAKKKKEEKIKEKSEDDQALDDALSSETKIENEIDKSKIEKEDNKKRPIRFHKRALTEDRFDSMFEELELILLQNNVAYHAIDSIRESLKSKLVGNSLRDIDLAEELKNSIKEVLIDSPDFIKTIKDSLKEKSPYVILFSGINGAGKTTTIAKIVYLLQKNNLTSCVVAADTFRAAAIQQLEEHANKLEVPIIKKDYGTDPAAVAFDGIAYAKKNKIDVVLIDTAGRLQNRDSLMKEIEKISRVSKANMKIFLGESITGNDATEQAKVFNETISIDGIILSKADVDEKGGTAISASAVTGKPILFLGTGQEYKDLEVFDKEKLIEKLGL